jgi:hypothetical protein
MADFVTAEESQALYGTHAYTGWGKAEAQADYSAKNPGGAIQQQPQAQPVAQPQPQPQQQPQAQPGQPQTAQDLVNMGYYGYTGWGDREAIADFNATGGQGKGGATAGGGTSGTGVSGLNDVLNAQPSIDLPGLYQNLYNSSGISDKEATLVDLESKFLEARNKISDNPFLSASMIDQRLQRLQNKYEKETAPIRSEIAMKKADIETQLNLETQQFDIESEQAKNSLAYAQTLLEMGALDNASGEDIAQLTYATGIPSSMWQSAIESRKEKDLETSLVTSTADSGEVTTTLINTQTGEVIKQTSLGNIGNQQTGSGGNLSVTQQAEADKLQNIENLKADARAGIILRDLVNHYGGVLSVEEIYRIYNTVGYYGQALETVEEAEQGIFKA